MGMSRRSVVICSLCLLCLLIINYSRTGNRLTKLAEFPLNNKDHLPFERDKTLSQAVGKVQMKTHFDNGYENNQSESTNQTKLDLSNASLVMSNDLVSKSVDNNDLKTTGRNGGKFEVSDNVTETTRAESRTDGDFLKTPTTSGFSDKTTTQTQKTTLATSRISHNDSTTVTTVGNNNNPTKGGESFSSDEDTPPIVTEDGEKITEIVTMEFTTDESYYDSQTRGKDDENPRNVEDGYKNRGGDESDSISTENDETLSSHGNTVTATAMFKTVELTTLVSDDLKTPDPTKTQSNATEPNWTSSSVSYKEISKDASKSKESRGKSVDQGKDKDEHNDVGDRGEARSEITITQTAGRVMTMEATKLPEMKSTVKKPKDDKHDVKTISKDTVSKSNFA